MAATATLETLIDAERRVDALVAAARVEAQELVRRALEQAAQSEQQQHDLTQQARAAAAERVHRRTQQAIIDIERENQRAIAHLTALSETQVQTIALQLLRLIVSGRPP